MELEGTPSDRLPDVLATGETSVRHAFLSLSAREPEERDADYIEWHSLDHRPEQYRLAGVRNTLRLVSTPACRKLRAASSERFDAVDHIMTYLFVDDDLDDFIALGGALDKAGRMPLRLPSLGYLTGALAGKVAAPRAVAGADVVPWRPAKGIYLMIEKGQASPASLVDLPGVAGMWWFQGTVAPEPFGSDARGLQITYCYLDADPLAVAGKLNEALERRWATGEAEGLLAAPFYTIVPFDWGRYVPGEG